jgi:methylated-DNA-[protein]-cysteine S-methyltransferase
MGATDTKAVENQEDHMPTLKELPHAVTTHTTIESPLGGLTVVIRANEVAGLYFPHHWPRPDPATFGEADDTGAEEVRRQLGEYFSGDRRSFDLPLKVEGDEFQQRVWEMIGQVAYAETTSYGQLAREIDGGTTPQEVGAAVGQNPLSILVPCHRVIGAGGKLIGYAGGLRRKQFLLDLEREVAGRPGRLF